MATTEGYRKVNIELLSTFQEEAIRTTLGDHICDALRILLSEKHLYQHVIVNVEFLDPVALAVHKAAKIRAAEPGLGPRQSFRNVPPLIQFRAAFDTFLAVKWFPADARPLVDTGMDILFQNNPTVQKYPLPTIKVTCDKCGEREPFNPIGALVETAQKVPTDQWIYLSYQCQACKPEPIRLIIRRAGLKLTLCGRDPFEKVEFPSFIPKRHASNFRNALIASHAGQTLAGIFLMRVFVEQFWKSVPAVAAAVKDKERPTGNELGEAYKATLPPAFKDGFPTLLEVYNLLSEDMHSARGDDAVFEKCRSQIVRHFDARRLFELSLPSDPPEASDGGSEGEELRPDTADPITATGAEK